jgi:hypothetical protein
MAWKDSSKGQDPSSISKTILLVNPKVLDLLDFNKRHGTNFNPSSKNLLVRIEAALRINPNLDKENLMFLSLRACDMQSIWNEYQPLKRG